MLERVKTLRILIQSNGAALLLDGHAGLVARAECDGAHLSGTDALKAAAPGLKPKYIAGCGGLGTRHDAMLAGESGADYVMFGEPNGRRPGFDAVLERVVWWAEIFQVPCVGYAADVDEVAALAARGRRIRRGRRSGLALSGEPSRCGGAACRGARAMKPLRLLILGAAIGVLAGDGVGAQPMQITPPVARPPASIPAKPAKPKEKPKAAVKPAVKAAAKPPAAKKSIAAPAAPAIPAAPPTAYAPENPLVQQPFTAPEKPAQTLTKTTALQPEPAAGAQGDVAYGAYQRGYYLEAFREATRRASEQGDPVAMTLLGDLYANGYGVVRDESKALAWFSLAADRGDRQAIFALAMSRFAGRGGPQDKAEAAALLDKAAKLGHVAAAYNLALLYLEGQELPQNIVRAAELMRSAADAGSPEAQYALATLYKEGNGVAKDPVAAARLLGAAARSGIVAAEVEYAIALFNGTGTAKDENAAAALFRKAAQKGNAVAQNRLARILATGRGLPADPIAATKWHTIAKAGGASDIWLENYMQRIKDNERAAGENAARLWLAHAKPNS